VLEADMTLVSSTTVKGETPMAKEPFTMVELDLEPDHNGKDGGTIQVRSTDLERMKKALGDRVKGAGAKKAPPAKNKARNT
jgi:hypothetical protein